jgi:hypothetical protein
MGLLTLTLWQPWASLVQAGVKTVETRSWSTKHRGRIAIHAGQSVAMLKDASSAWDHFDLDVYHATRQHADALAEPLPVGAIVATAELVDVVPMCDITWATEPGWRTDVLRSGVDHVEHVYVGEDQRPYGDFAPGRYAWLLSDVKPTTERCPACWGNGWRTYASEMCDTCTPAGGYSGTGRCAPVPAKGQLGLWKWMP